MSKYCPMCDAVTNCTDNCKLCLEEENENAWNEAVDFGGVHTIPHEKEQSKMIDHYKMTMSIYHIDEEDENANKGEPFMTYAYGVNLYEMKRNISHTLVLIMKQFKLQDGLTLVECDIEKNGEYFDSDTGYYRVDLANGTAKFLID